MTEVRHLIARMDLDQKIGQIQGVVPMDLVDFAKLAVRRGASRSVEGVPLRHRPAAAGSAPRGRPPLAGVAARPRPRTAPATRSRGSRSRTRAEPVRHRDARPRRRHQRARARAGPPVRDAVGSGGELGSGGVPHGRRDRGRSGAVGRYPLVLVATARSRDATCAGAAYTRRTARTPSSSPAWAIGFIRGVQGDAGDSGTLATGKHFLGYGQSLGGLNQAATQLGRSRTHRRPRRALPARNRRSRPRRSS